MKALSENGTHASLCNPEMIQAIFELERRRQKALVDVDLDTLHSLFDDELIHVHSTGLVHDKSQLLAHIARKRGFLAIERGPLHVQGTAALAVLSGPIINHLRGADALNASGIRVMRDPPHGCHETSRGRVVDH